MLFIFFLIIFIYILIFKQGIINKITGKQVFSDTDFELPAESFKPSNPTRKPILLSPPDCKIISYIPLNIDVLRGDSFSVIVSGKGCGNSSLELVIYDNDYFFDDYILTSQGNFVENEAVFNFSAKDSFDSFFGFFEGQELELYFEPRLL